MVIICLNYSTVVALFQAKIDVPTTFTIGPIRDSRQKLILHPDKRLLKLSPLVCGGSVKANLTSENRELIQAWGLVVGQERLPLLEMLRQEIPR